MMGLLKRWKENKIHQSLHYCRVEQLLEQILKTIKKQKV